MDDRKKEKIEDRIKEVVSRYVERESNKTSIISVNRVELYDKGRKANIYISVMPESGEESALNFIKRQRSELKDEIKRYLSIKTIPFLDVAIDMEEKARNNIEALLKRAME